MKLIFGLQLDDLVLPQTGFTEGGVYYCGPKSLLALLETMTGLGGHPENIEFLRVEHYRQALLAHLDGNPHPFYRKSFEADQFATASDLMNRRDELLLAGWDFSECGTMQRLKTIAEVDVIFKKGIINGTEVTLPPLGFADRFVRVLQEMKFLKHLFSEIQINEPIEILPSHFQVLFELMAKTEGTTLYPIASTQPQANPTTDLEHFKNTLLNGKSKKITPLADGSLVIVKAKRDHEAASFIAKLMRENPGFKPSCLIPEKNRVLEMALVGEGFPSMGILSASLARPALQILKLAPTFLWNPIDPYKILEFVSLALKPLPDRLATEIAEQVAKTPGLRGDRWYAMVGKYFSQLEEKESAKVVDEQRKQYGFWFERQRYSIDKAVPKSEAIAMYEYLRQWSHQVFEENGARNNSLLVLSEQAKRIVELLQALPETELGFLALERIVRTIYEPSPVVFQEMEVGHLPYTMYPGAFIGNVEEVLWWNFIQNDTPAFFSRWHADERAFLTQSGAKLDSPSIENARQLWQRARPVLSAQKRLVLVVPEISEGEEALPHPLLGNLEAVFDTLQPFTIDVQQRPTGETLLLKMPLWEKAGVRSLSKSAPFINIGEITAPQREYETLTSLDTLFYYPYQWFFRYKIKLHKSAILSVVKDNTLMGNLAHRVFEKLMLEDLSQFENKQVLDEWIEEQSGQLLHREGAVLLMYGREPERIAFVNKLKYSAWSLLSHIRENGWEVVETEKSLEGFFPEDSAKGKNVPVKCIADLVLKRGSEMAIIDLKWRGASYRATTLRNEEDLQLVMYAKLLSEKGQWPHTGYFIMENGKMVVRNNLAFKRVTPVVPAGDYIEINERVLNRMEETWHWRMAQIAKGEIEIRTRQNLSQIEAKYGDDYSDSNQMSDILELKGEDAKWDDYRTLVALGK